MTVSNPLKAAEVSEEACTNSVQVVGYLAVQGRGEKNSVGRPGRDTGGRLQHRVQLQVVEEDGSTYALPIRAAAPLLADLPLERPSRVSVRGILAWRQGYDTRYATAERPEGRANRQLNLEVSEIRPAAEDEVDGSWVRLRGEVIEPPSVRQHEREAAMTVFRGMLQVQVRQAATRSGSRCTHVHVERIPVDVPLALDGSTAAARRGNIIEIEGRLEPFLQQLRENHPDIQQVLAVYEQAWEEQRQRAQGQAQIAAGRRISRERYRLLHAAQLRVRAGFIELIAGSPISAQEAFAERERWNRQRRATRRRGPAGQDLHAATPEGLLQGAAFADDAQTLIRAQDERPNSTGGITDMLAALP